MKRPNLLAAIAAAVALPSPLAAAETGANQEVVVTSSRLDVGLPGASASVITAADIAASTARTLPELLAGEAGVQSRDLYGATAAARATVDLRGLGATATQNTLVLLNGRRLNDIDLAAIDWAAIPLASIRRVEVVRGGAAAVLYGDGAVGGAINIVTKGAPERPGGVAAATVGSFDHRQAELAYAQSVGAFWARADGAYLTTEGYRDNNNLTQRNIVAELRHASAAGEVFFRLNADNQSLGLPGERRVCPTLNAFCPAPSEVASDPRGSHKPLDQSKQNGVAASAGLSLALGAGVELVLDFGARRKDQEASFVSSFNYVDTDLTTWSLTPRLNLDYTVGGLAAQTAAGVDYYFATYNSDRKQDALSAPVHRFDATQHSLAAYAQNTLTLAPGTDVSAGVRLQRIDVSVQDRFDATAPGGGFGNPIAPLDDVETVWSAGAGVEQRLGANLTAFGRMGRGVRLPTIDDRIGVSPFGVTVGSFELDTQTSRDAELGARYASQALNFQTGVFVMAVRDEIHFDPVTFTNRNLDPTRRAGVENSLSWAVSESVRVNAAATYTRAKFTGGPLSGNDVPLVSPWTANAAATWKVRPELAVTARLFYASEKRMDNDEANFQPRIPGYALVDLKLGGDVGPLFWSLAANNLLDREYFNYAVASATTFGRYNAYPLPGRTFLFQAGMRF
jgi:iron complex outermembrane recepter protein